MYGVLSGFTEELYPGRVISKLCNFGTIRSDRLLFPQERVREKSIGELAAISVVNNAGIQIHAQQKECITREVLRLMWQRCLKCTRKTRGGYRS